MLSSRTGKLERWYKPAWIDESYIPTNPVDYGHVKVQFPLHSQIVLYCSKIALQATQKLGNCSEITLCSTVGLVKFGISNHGVKGPLTKIKTLCTGFGHQGSCEEADVRCSTGSLFVWRFRLIIGCQHCSQVCPSHTANMNWIVNLLDI